MVSRMLVRSLVLLAAASAGAAADTERPTRDAEPAGSDPRAAATAAVPDRIGALRFATGSTRVDVEDAAIATAVEWMADHPDRLLYVEGHADRRGSRRLNLRLSQQRADAVRAALVRAGADPLRIVAAAYGEREASGVGEASRKVVLRGSTALYSELIQAQRSPTRVVERTDRGQVREPAAGTPRAPANPPR